MSAPARAIVTKATNTLLPRAQRGRGLTVEDMLEAAGQVIEQHSAGGRNRMLQAIADARAAIAHRNGEAARAGLLAKLTAMAEEAEAQGRVLGNPLLTEVGVRLGIFVSRFAKIAVPDAKAATAIALHLDAMIVALDRRKDTLDALARVLLNNLELTERTLRSTDR